MSDHTPFPDPELNDIPAEPAADGDSTPIVEVHSSPDRAEQDDAAAIANDKLLRLAAEYDNFRRRTLKEKAESADRGAMQVVSRLLDALDDFDRLEANGGEEGAFRDAFVLVKRKFQQALESTGLERIAPAEVPFDPTEHEAVSVVAPEHPEQDHLVKTTFQAGYRFKGMVIRPARVQVYSEQGTA